MSQSLAALNLLISGDATQLQRTLAQVKADVKLTFKEIQNATDTVQLEKLNQRYSQLLDQQKALRNFGVAQEFNKTADASKNARTALTSLSLVAQDLPFGFIGIQNNLPGLISSFGDLTTKSKGIGGALKELGSTLVGPAGIFLAFSVVTSAITFAVQKYGSLSNAINVLIGTTSALTEQQVLLNKASASAAGNAILEESKLKILSKTLIDLKQPYKNRLAAYDELRKISPDVVAGIDRENISSAASVDIIDKQVKARLELLKLKVQEAGINAVLEKNSADLAVVRQKLSVAQQQEYEFSRKLEMSTKNQGAAALAASQGINTYAISLNKVRGTIAELEQEQSKLVGINEQYFKQLAPIVNSTAEINSQTQTLIQNYKDQAKAAREVTGIGNIYEGEGGVGTIIEDNAKVSKAFAASRKIINTSIKKSIELRRKEFLKSPVRPVGAAPAGLSVDKIQQIQDEVSKIGELARIEDKILKVRSTLEEGFFRPLQRSFTDFLLEGKFTFKEFGNSVLDAIKRIVAKLAATGISKLLANLLAPGIGGVIAGAEVGSAAGNGGFFTNLLSGLFRGVAAPSFGGVTGGGMEMAGQVNLLLRGSDLVGAINRTNAQISRTG